MKSTRSFAGYLAFLLVLLCLAFSATGRASPFPEYVQVTHPEWSKNATIYEVNIRQFTPEGTFNAFKKHLPRLKNMGVDILWLMPIHPIGELNRKGSEGSYYSVKDYLAVNPKFGTMEDFKALVKDIHALDMKIIIDWVPNHSAWDNPLATAHPDWYSKDAHGNFQPTPWYDWSDVIDFDYNHPALRNYMKNAMKFWVEQANIDGYRVDVAGFVPLDFWEKVRKELDAIKPVFMLAEWESRDLHKEAFDMTYAWELHDTMLAVAQKKADVNKIFHYFAHNHNAFPDNAYRMNFVDNHDKNSWEKTAFERFGPALEVSMVLAATAEGMPLVYSGQEAGLNKVLAFFEKDLIAWKPHPFYQMYQTLFSLKKHNQALWNGHWGGEMQPVINNKPEQVLSFLREKNGHKVFVVLNYSDKQQHVRFADDLHTGRYYDVFSQQKTLVKAEQALTLPPYGYKVLATPAPGE